MKHKNKEHALPFPSFLSFIYFLLLFNIKCNVLPSHYTAVNSRLEKMKKRR